MLELTLSCDREKSLEEIKQKTIEVAETQYNKIGDLYELQLIPRTHYEDGRLRTVSPYDWTSGFFGGSMWYMYELTKEFEWREKAINYTEILDTIQWYSGNHDVGFMINCSYGNGYRIGGVEEYKQVMINAAESLSRRFNPNVGLIKSWNRSKSWDGETNWYFPVIVDNMMNLELLFEASALSGNNHYRDIAIIHADNTMKHHYRPDYSSYHVVDFDSITGRVLDKGTHQGYADNSSWARGQAWGFYGFVITYRATKDKRYLDFAIKIANYMITHSSLPKDKIPYWDYHVGDIDYQPLWDYQKGEFYFYRDVSAATITASALIELATYVDDGSSEHYIEVAKEIVQNLSTSNYMASEDDQNYFILKHSVTSVPHGVEVDKPLNYADYYYLEALTRLSRYIKDQNVLPENSSIAK